jgi:hypothetical protein
MPAHELLSLLEITRQDFSDTLSGLSPRFGAAHWPRISQQCSGGANKLSHAL